ncbi:MAG: tRNA pseudouridine(55) synthase TruB [Saprospiraceae bacterium]|nr:tRNA pseudouridine(55) synthase TruB [Saprospiraceae bacterium]
MDSPSNPFYLSSSNELPDFWAGNFLLVDKPYGLSSFKIVHEIRKAITSRSNRKLKIGHAGTLDPLASGLLILATGKRTSELSLFQDLEKTYEGRLRLGFTRASYDMESEISGSYVVPEKSDAQIEFIRNSLTGLIKIPPPLHSAVKLGGKRAYKLARAGSDVQLEPKEMLIKEFALDISHYPEILFKVVCSKGTYIRSLAHEFGHRMGCGAYLSALSRTAIGTYTIAQSWNFKVLLHRLYESNQR